MARGGGGAGRGGGGARGGFRKTINGNGKSWAQKTPGERVLGVLFFGFFLVASLFMSIDESRAVAEEERLADFASARYELHFGDTACHEDNLLLAFVVYEDCEQFSYMTWVGDHINDATFDQLRGEGTWLDDLLTRQVELDYRDTLSEDLSGAIRAMAEQIQSEAPAGSYTCSEDHSESPTGLHDLTELDLNRELIEASLEYFRETTGIPMVLVVEDATDLYQ